jgi:hypothetical protein
MAVDHKSRARKIWPHLAKLAVKRRPPLSYGVLGGMVGVHPRVIRWPLGVIQRYCKEHGLPALQALAVNKKTRLPGVGYVGSPRTPRAHQTELRKVYNRSWKSTAPF